MWKDLEEGRAEILCSSCAYGKVHWIRPKYTRIAPRWKVWGRILQWYGGDPTWRIFWFPSPSKREMPSPGEPLTPGHINGGYTMPCETRSIVIYRKEDAERVLMHELQHASCLDNMKDPVEMREAKTEFWAELFMVALFSHGSQERGARLWKLQSQWIVDQNHTLRTLHGIQGPKDYVWRYTLGKELVAQQMRIRLPSPRSTKSRSLRLAAPIFDTL